MGENLILTITIEKGKQMEGKYDILEDIVIIIEDDEEIIEEDYKE